MLGPSNTCHSELAGTVGQGCSFIQMKELTNSAEICQDIVRRASGNKGASAPQRAPPDTETRASHGCCYSTVCRRQPLSRPATRLEEVRASRPTTLCSQNGEIRTPLLVFKTDRVELSALSVEEGPTMGLSAANVISDCGAPPTGNLHCYGWI